MARKPLDVDLALFESGNPYKQRLVFRIWVLEVRIVARILYPVLLIAASLVVLWFLPMVLLLVLYAGAFVALLLSRQLNFYKMVMVLKRYAQKLGSKLRFAFRTRMRLGFRDYADGSLDGDKELRRGRHGYVR